MVALLTAIRLKSACCCQYSADIPGKTWTYVCASINKKTVIENLSVTKNSRLCERPATPVVFSE